jgi:hypothetical protein
MRIVLLIVSVVVLVSACGPSRVERPLDGARVGVDGRSASADNASGPPPTLSAPPSPQSGAASPITLASPIPSPSPSPVAGYVIVATDGAGANLRTGPSMTAPIIATLAEGTPVEVYEGPVSAEGRSWQKIRSGNREGWVVSVVVRRR